MSPLLVAAIAAALAAPAAQDSVTGTVSSGDARDFVQFRLDGHSGPAGESPTGTVWLDSFFGPIGPFDVSCLKVSGTRAGMIARAPANAGIAGLAIDVEDGGPGQDRLNWRILSTLPSGCPAPVGPLSPVERGDLVVTDVLSKAQCKNGGWRQLGFKNQGACVSSSRRAP